MIGHVRIKSRGAAPRGMRKAYNAQAKDTWLDTGKFFHVQFRDARFTKTHAQAAGYFARKGEKLAPGSKAYRRSYTGRKQAKFGHTRPLEFSGESRRLARNVHLVGSRSGVKARYPGLRKLNFRHPKSRIRMAEEFRRMLPKETAALARYHDRQLDKRLAASSITITTTVP